MPVSTEEGIFSFPTAIVAEVPLSGPHFGEDCDKCRPLNSQ